METVRFHIDKNHLNSDVKMVYNRIQGKAKNNMEAISTELIDTEYAENIMELTECFISQLDPKKIFLFGSFADGSYSEDSDYDFYIVVDDRKNIHNEAILANKSIRNKMKRPVDIVIGTDSRFQNLSQSKDSLMIEGEVQRNGILLYDSTRKISV